MPFFAHDLLEKRTPIRHMNRPKSTFFTKIPKFLQRIIKISRSSLRKFAIDAGNGRRRVSVALSRAPPAARRETLRCKRVCEECSCYHCYIGSLCYYYCSLSPFRSAFLSGAVSLICRLSLCLS